MGNLVEGWGKTMPQQDLKQPLKPIKPGLSVWASKMRLSTGGDGVLPIILLCWFAPRQNRHNRTQKRKPDPFLSCSRARLQHTSLRRQTESRAGVCDAVFLGVLGRGAGIVPAAVRVLRLRLQLRAGPGSHPSSFPLIQS